WCDNVSMAACGHNTTKHNRWMVEGLNRVDNVPIMSRRTAAAAAEFFGHHLINPCENPIPTPSPPPPIPTPSPHPSLCPIVNSPCSVGRSARFNAQFALHLCSSSSLL